MRSGELKSTVELLALTRVDDGAGGAAVTTTVEKEFRCRITPMAGLEQANEGQLQERITHKILARYDAAVTHLKRLRIKGTSRVLDIIEVINVRELGRDMFVRCVERKAQ